MKRERENLNEDKEFSTPKSKKRYARNMLRVDPDNFDRESIRRVILEFYEKKQHVTLDKLLVSNYMHVYMCFK
jgi:hypothetical protein